MSPIRTLDIGMGGQNLQADDVWLWVRYSRDGFVIIIGVGSEERTHVALISFDSS